MFKKLWKVFFLIFLFTVAYLTLSIIKHNHFLSGYDLAVSDQVMWKYAYFHNPLTTIHAYPFTYMMTDHVEFIFMFLAPLFWLWNDVRMLIGAQVIFFCLSAIPIYLLARKKGINEWVSLTLVFSYLFFFGTQNALWNDVHSNVFGTAFIAWMIYFLETGQNFWMWLSFFFAITAKEDIAFITGAIGLVWLVKNTMSFLRKQESRIIFPGSPREGDYSLIKSGMTILKKNKTSLLFILFSLIYLFLVFGIYFPHFTPQGYRFAGNESTLSNLFHWNYFADTASKRQIIFYSMEWFGFLPIFAPLYLLPAIADLFHYFVLGHLVESASEIFLHYRVDLAPLLVWPTIYAVSVILNLIQNLFPGSSIKSRMTGVQLFLAIYLLICAFFAQYTLHLPLSYLTKSWFWHESSSVASINHVITYLPPQASVVSQNNITPHIGHRDNIFTLWGDTRGYKTIADSPCGKLLCPWFHWVGNPQYMIVDTSSDWDIRHYLQNRPDFLDALSTFEKLGKIKVVKRIGTTTLYAVLQKP